MKIEIHRNKELIAFASIVAGEEFMYSERLHMRTDNKDYNAVDLEDGTLRHLCDDEFVGIVDAIITIQP